MVKEWRRYDDVEQGVKEWRDVEGERKEVEQEWRARTKIKKIRMERRDRVEGRKEWRGGRIDRKEWTKGERGGGRRGERAETDSRGLTNHKKGKVSLEWRKCDYWTLGISGEAFVWAPFKALFLPLLYSTVRGGQWTGKQGNHYLNAFKREHQGTSWTVLDLAYFFWTYILIVLFELFLNLFFVIWCSSWLSFKEQRLVRFLLLLVFFFSWTTSENVRNKTNQQH